MVHLVWLWHQLRTLTWIPPLPQGYTGRRRRGRRLSAMYAIVKVGGKQYRVEKGDSVVVDRLREDEGASVTLEPLLLAGDGKDKAVFERDDLAKVKVEALVAGHERGRKVHVLKFKPKKGYRRRSGHRSDLTRLEIKDIKMLSRRPAAKKEPAEAKAESAAAEAPKKEPAAKAEEAPKRGTARRTTPKADAPKAGTAQKRGATKKESAPTAKKDAPKRTTGRKAPARKKKEESGDGS